MFIVREKKERRLYSKIFRNLTPKTLNSIINYYIKLKIHIIQFF